MSVMMKLRGTLVFAALAASGCGAYDPSEIVEGDVGDVGDVGEVVGTETQELWQTWSPIGRSMLGAARSPKGRPYAWLGYGASVPTVCYGAESLPGGFDNFCGTEQAFYSPLPAKDIRAVTIKQDNSRVVAWYADSANPHMGWYSAGTATNLDSSTPLTVFTPALKNGSERFTMNQLVDADHNLVDGRYYYYWNTRTCDIVRMTCTPDRIYRTIGSLTLADAYSPATEVRIFQKDSTTAGRILVGVAIHNTNPFPGLVKPTAKYIAYYGDGFQNVSTNSLDFNQP